MRGVAALVLALVSCSPGVDVVARATNVADAGDGSAKTTTCRDDQPMIIATSSSLYEFDITKPSKPIHIPASCLDGAIGAVAVDRDRRIWVASGNTLTAIDPDTHECNRKEVTISISAMAFVWDPRNERESLYAIDAGILAVFDPSTLSREPSGKLDSTQVRALAGTRDGRLLAFSPALPQVFQVNLANGSLTPRWEVGQGMPSELVGGIVGIRGLLLVIDTQIFRLDYPKDMTAIDTIAGLDGDIVGVSTSPCWSTTN